MGVGHEQLTRVRRAELAAERAKALRGERRSRGSGQEPVLADGEAVDLGGPDAGPDELAAIPVEQHIPWLRAAGQRDGRAGDRLQAAVVAEPEPGVVAAAVTGVAPVPQPAVDPHADP